MHEHKSAAHEAMGRKSVQKGMPKTAHEVQTGSLWQCLFHHTVGMHSYLLELNGLAIHEMITGTAKEVALA